MQRRLVPALMLFSLACGGRPAGGPAPLTDATSPQLAVQNFMQGVADSNIAMMSRYWGTRNGPASVTRQPPDYEQRLGITQVFLRASPYKVVGTEPVPGDTLRQVVQVELERRDADGTSCSRALPITVVKAGSHGWIVQTIDISQVGTPGRACRPGRAS